MQLWIVPQYLSMYDISTYILPYKSTIHVGKDTMSWDAMGTTPSKSKDVTSVRITVRCLSCSQLFHCDWEIPNLHGGPSTTEGL